MTFFIIKAGHYHTVLTFILFFIFSFLRCGSVIASFTIFFTAFDSFQTVYVVDAIEVDGFLGKLPIVRPVNGTNVILSINTGEYNNSISLF